MVKRALIWVALLVLAWFAGKYGEQFGLPAPHVIVSVVIGLVVASTGLMRRTVPKHLHTAAQAVTGVVIGTFLNAHALATTGGSLLPLLAITVATLVFSLAGGLVLARWTGLDQTTASLGMVAGGSAAIVGAAEDLDADARMVAFMQYLRLVLVVLAMPLLIRFVFAPGAGHFRALGAEEIEVPFSVGGWVFLLWAAPAGYVLGKLLRLPAPALLGPVILGAIVTIAGISVNPPEVAREIAFNIIGLEVGLRLTPSALRAMGRMLPKVLLFVLLITGICAVLAWVVTLVTDISPADAYLATTPGGINAVLATASSVHADVALVFSVQTLRLFAMVLLAPPALKWWLSRQAAKARTEPESAEFAQGAEVAIAEID
ncbi:MAG: uncharacterized protein QOE61_4605 [Micromonosporaceae bacterium]|jgi:membrane AbrB-like protein|nr:uncharacterized protein [Micromonosporaceae bacterium]